MDYLDEEEMYEMEHEEEMEMYETMLAQNPNKGTRSGVIFSTAFSTIFSTNHAYIHVYGGYPCSSLCVEWGEHGLHELVGNPTSNEKLVSCSK